MPKANAELSERLQQNFSGPQQG